MTPNSTKAVVTDKEQAGGGHDDSERNRFDSYHCTPMALLGAERQCLSVSISL